MQDQELVKMSREYAAAHPEAVQERQRLIQSLLDTQSGAPTLPPTPEPAEVMIPAPTGRVNIDIKSNAGLVYLVLSGGNTHFLPISLTPAQALSMANRLRGKANDLLHAEYQRRK